MALAVNQLSGFGSGGGGGGASVGDAPQTNLIHHWAHDVGVTESGGLVSQWDDQIGSANFVEATDKPTYSATSGAAGLGGITFDGVNDTMKIASLTTEAPFNIFMVFKHITWVAGNMLVTAGGGWNIYQQTNTPELSLVYDYVRPTVAFTLNTFFLIDALYDGASSHIALNDGSPTVADPGGPYDGYNLVLGANSGQTGSFCNWVVSEIAILEAAAVRADWHTYILARYPGLF